MTDSLGRQESQGEARVPDAVLAVKHALDRTTPDETTLCRFRNAAVQAGVLQAAFVEVNRQRGTTIALIEHDMGVVMDLSDRVVVLDYGRKIAEGGYHDVVNQPAVIEAYLGKRASKDVIEDAVA